MFDTSPVRQLVSLPLLWPSVPLRKASIAIQKPPLSVVTCYIILSLVKCTTCINLGATVYLKYCRLFKLHSHYMVINGTFLPSGLPTYTCSKGMFSFPSFSTVIIFPTFVAPIVFLPIVHIMIFHLQEIRPSSYFQIIIVYLGKVRLSGFSSLAEFGLTDFYQT